MGDKYYSGDLALIHPNVHENMEENKAILPKNGKEEKSESVSVDLGDGGWPTVTPIISTFPAYLEKRLKIEEQRSQGTFLQKCQQNQVSYSVLCIYGTIQIFFSLIFYFSRDFLFLEYMLYVVFVAPFVKIILTVYTNFEKSDGICSGLCKGSSHQGFNYKKMFKILIESIFPISWIRIFTIQNGSHNISKSIKFELCVAYFLFIQFYYALILILPGFKLSDYYSLLAYYSAIIPSMVILNYIVVRSQTYSVQIIDMIDSSIGLNLLQLTILPLRMMPRFYHLKDRKYRPLPLITTVYFVFIFSLFHVSASFLPFDRDEALRFVFPFLLYEFGWMPCTTQLEVKIVELFKGQFYYNVYKFVLFILSVCYMMSYFGVAPFYNILTILYLIIGIFFGFSQEGWQKTVQFIAVIFCIFLHVLILGARSNRKF